MMKKRKFLTQVLPAVIVLTGFIVYLIIFRENFFQGMADALRSFK